MHTNCLQIVYILIKNLNLTLVSLPSTFKTTPIADTQTNSDVEPAEFSGPHKVHALKGKGKTEQ